MASSIQVVLPPTTYCSGSYVEGEVQFNFRRLQESEDRFERIWVTLRGRAHCVCADDESAEREVISLVDLSRLLWTYGSEYPPPNSDVLRLFFRFQLPDYTPPSFRPSCPWKQHIPIVVVPYDDVSPLLTRSLSSSALVWRTEHKDKKVRRKLWGEYASVRIELSIPDIPVFPLFTPIPFKIDVNTITAAVVRHTRRDGSRDSGHARIFPTPPSDPSEVTFQLVRRLKIRAHKREETRQSVTTRYIGFVGTSCCERVDVDVPEKEWVQMHDVSTSESSHSTKERGVWVQCAQFKSKLVFNVPPTFSIRDRLEWEYLLKLKVPFSGLGNDVELEMPVTVVSGINKPAPRKNHQPPSRLSGAYASVSELSLPREYWQGQGTWEWKQFNKGIDAHSPRS